jgi:hypothetical protein
MSAEDILLLTLVYTHAAANKEMCFFFFFFFFFGGCFFLVGGVVVAVVVDVVACEPWAVDEGVEGGAARRECTDLPHLWAEVAALPCHQHRMAVADLQHPQPTLSQVLLLLTKFRSL